VPELPDVEGFRRVLAEHAVGRRIERVEADRRSTKE
jgi:formamidopyrimidine-DNA glycosylase